MQALGKTVQVRDWALESEASPLRPSGEPARGLQAVGGSFSQAGWRQAPKPAW